MRTLILLLITTGAGVAADPPEYRVPFADLRAKMPADGVVIEVSRVKDKFPKNDGEYKDEWVQLALGKRLKVHPKDRTPANETNIDDGKGITLSNGLLIVKAGWRVRKELPVVQLKDFDGTVVAKIAVCMNAGKWHVNVEAKSEWNGFGPVIGEEINGAVEKQVRTELTKLLTDELTKQQERLFQQFPPLKPLAQQLSATLTGDSLVVRAVPLTPVLDLGEVKDRRGAKKMTLTGGFCGNLSFKIIDRSELDGTAMLACSLIEVKERIDGQSSIDLRAATGASVVIRGRIDGQSQVTIIMPEGKFEIHDRIDGQSGLTVYAPGGHVVFHKKVDGQSHLKITAKTVEFMEEIDGGIHHDKKTLVELFLPSGGKATGHKYYNAHVIWKQTDAGPPPVIQLGRRDRDGKLEEAK